MLYIPHPGIRVNSPRPCTARRRRCSEMLQELQQVNVDPELPDISTSLGLLKAYLAQPAPGETAKPMADAQVEAGAEQ